MVRTNECVGKHVGRKRHIGRLAVSALVTLAMVPYCVPVAAFAATNDAPEEQSAEEQTLGTLTVKDGATVTQADVKGYENIALEGDATFEDVSFTASKGSAVIPTVPNTKISIAGSCEFTGALNSAGIQVPEGYTVNIEIAKSSSLSAKGNAGKDFNCKADSSKTGNSCASGIGGTKALPASGTIVISGADNTSSTLSAAGGGIGAAGIGPAYGGQNGGISLVDLHLSGVYGGCQNATTEGGRATYDSALEGGAAIGGGSKAQGTNTISLTNCIGTDIVGGSKAAGIGGGCWSGEGHVLITNSTLQVKGGATGAAIGAGRVHDQSDFEVVISSDKGTAADKEYVINAVGGAYGAGVGIGYNNKNFGSLSSSAKLRLSSVSISGEKTKVVATGGMGAAGIGGGYKGVNIDVSITDGADVTGISGLPGENAKIPKTNTVDGVLYGQAGGAGIGHGGMGSIAFGKSATLTIDKSATVKAYSSGDRFAIDGFENYNLDSTVLQTRFSRDYGKIATQEPDAVGDVEQYNCFLNAHGSSSFDFGGVKLETPSGAKFEGLEDANLGYYSIAATVDGPGDYRILNSSDEVANEYKTSVGKAVEPGAKPYAAAASYLEDGDYATRNKTFSCEEGLNSFDQVAFRGNWFEVAGYEGYYDADEHTVTVDASDSRKNTVFEYSLDGKTWSKDAPTFKDVELLDGSVAAHKVYVKASVAEAPDVIKTGTVKVNPLPITIKTGSKQKAYDGTPLTSSEIDIAMLFEGGKVSVESANTMRALDADASNATVETMRLVPTGSQTEVGSSENTYEIEWADTAQDPTGLSAKSVNYKLSEELGTLTVVTAESTPGEEPANPEDEEPTIVIDDEETPLASGDEIVIDDGQGTGSAVDTTVSSTDDNGGDVKEVVTDDEEDADDEDTVEVESDDTPTGGVETGDTFALFNIAATLLVALFGCAFAIVAYLRTRRNEQ